MQACKTQSCNPRYYSTTREYASLSVPNKLKCRPIFLTLRLDQTIPRSPFSAGSRKFILMGKVSLMAPFAFLVMFMHFCEIVFNPAIFEKDSGFFVSTICKVTNDSNEPAKNLKGLFIQIWV